jgi:hypothetical protein
MPPVQLCDQPTCILRIGFFFISYLQVHLTHLSVGLLAALQPLLCFNCWALGVLKGFLEPSFSGALGPLLFFMLPEQASNLQEFLFQRQVTLPICPPGNRSNLFNAAPLRNRAKLYAAFWKIGKTERCSPWLRTRKLRFQRPATLPICPVSITTRLSLVRTVFAVPCLAMKYP